MRPRHRQKGIKNGAERELKELRGQVRATFAEVLDMDPARSPTTAHFVNDLGGDSLQSISLAIKLEEKYDLLIPTEAFQSCVCVNDVARCCTACERPDEEAERRSTKRAITRFEDTPEYAAFLERQQGHRQAGARPVFRLPRVPPHRHLRAWTDGRGAELRLL
jgi:acyl carrier protein